MDQVHQEQGSVDEEALREMGVVLYPEESEGGYIDDDDDDDDDDDEADRDQLSNRCGSLSRLEVVRL